LLFFRDSSGVAVTSSPEIISAMGRLPMAASDCHGCADAAVRRRERRRKIHIFAGMALSISARARLAPDRARSHQPPLVALQTRDNNKLKRPQARHSLNVKNRISAPLRGTMSKSVTSHFARKSST
jgi:hypothetical protein